MRYSKDEMLVGLGEKIGNLETEKAEEIKKALERYEDSQNIILLRDIFRKYILSAMSQQELQKYEKIIPGISTIKLDPANRSTFVEFIFSYFVLSSNANGGITKEEFAEFKSQILHLYKIGVLVISDLCDYETVWKFYYILASDRQKPYEITLRNGEAGPGIFFK